MNLKFSINSLFVTSWSKDLKKTSISNVRLDGRSMESRLGSDSHADISCAGKHARILEHVHGQTCTVHPFHESYEPKKNIRICNAAYAYDDISGETVILKMNQCLDFSTSMEHSLFCTNQVRANGIIVDDIPKSIDVRNASKEALIVPSENSYEIPFKFKGPVPFIPVRTPSEEELETCRIIDITSEEPWNPENFMATSYKIDALSMANSEYLLDSPSPYSILDTTYRHMHVHAVNLHTKRDTDPIVLSKM